MKILVFVFLLSYSISIISNNLDIINLAEYDTVRTNLTKAGICLNINVIENEQKFYLSFTSKNGSINDTLSYEFLNENCYMNYSYNPEENSLNSIGKSSSSLYRKEFTYEYEFKKKPSSKYLFAVYHEYSGKELTIIFSGKKSKTVLIAFLIIFIAFVFLLIPFCFCCYRFCKRRNLAIMHTNSQSSFTFGDKNLVPL